VILSQILLNSASISEQKAIDIAVIIERLSSKYGVPGNVIASIAFVESSYKLNAVNKASNDYGIMQVNAWNVRVLKLNKARLLSDLEYSLDSGVQILAWFVKRYPLREAIMRYNCGTRPSCIRLSSVKKYLNKVVRYW
jgi:soluble lytic murein transglycosylase-like protein